MKSKFFLFFSLFWLFIGFIGSGLASEEQIYYEKGLVHYNSAQWDHAIRSFKKALTLTSSNELKQELNLMIGLSLYGKKRLSRSVPYFSEALKNSVDPVNTFKASLMLNRALHNPEKKFSAVTAAGVTYDNNVILETLDGTRYDRDVKAKNSTAANWLISPQVNMALSDSVNFLLSDQLSLNYYANPSLKQKYDTLSNTVQTTLSYPGSLLGGAFDFAHSLGHTTSFARETRDSYSPDQIFNYYFFDTSLEWLYAEHLSTRFIGGISRPEYKEYSRGGTVSRDGVDIHAGLDQTFPFLKGSWKASLDAAKQFRDGSNNNHVQRYNGNVSVNYPFLWNSLLQLGGGLFWNRYPKHALEHQENGGRGDISFIKMLGSHVGGMIASGYAQQISRDPLISSYKRFTVGTSLFYSF